MPKTPFIPSGPNIEPPDEETLKHLESFERESFKNSDAYKKYVQPVHDKENHQKKVNRIYWWKTNWIGIATLIIAILTLIATIVFGLQ